MTLSPLATQSPYHHASAMPGPSATTVTSPTTLSVPSFGRSSKPDTNTPGEKVSTIGFFIEIGTEFYEKLVEDFKSICGIAISKFPFQTEGFRIDTTNEEDAKGRAYYRVSAGAPTIPSEELNEAFDAANIHLTSTQGVAVLTEKQVLTWLKYCCDKDSLEHLPIADAPYRKVKGACVDPVGQDHTHHTLYTAPKGPNGERQFFLIGELDTETSANNGQQTLKVVHALLDNLYKAPKKNAH